MKKLFVTMLVVLVSMSAMAQDKKYGVGFNLLYGTEIKNVGFGVKGQYYATEAIRVEGNVGYYMKKDDVSMLDVNVTGHYLIPVAENLKVYPLAGVGITNWMYGGALKSLVDNTTKFTINLGGGIQYDVAEDFAINAEAKYQIIDHYNQVVFALGAVYKF